MVADMKQKINELDARARKQVISFIGKIPKILAIVIAGCLALWARSHWLWLFGAGANGLALWTAIVFIIGWGFGKHNFSHLKKAYIWIESIGDSTGKEPDKEK